MTEKYKALRKVMLNDAPADSGKHACDIVFFKKIISVIILRNINLIYIFCFNSSRGHAQITSFRFFESYIWY